MSRFSTSIGAGSLLTALTNSGHLDGASVAKAEALIREQAQHKELPLYLRILAGFGAFIAALCFIGFLGAAKIIDFKGGTEPMVWGLVFIIGAIGLAVLERDKQDTALHSFMMQLSLSVMGLGKILFVFGFVEANARYDAWSVSLGILLVTAATYFVHRSSVDRFLSILALLVSVSWAILFERPSSDYAGLQMNVYLVVVLAGSALFLVESKFKRAHIVVPYAAVLALCFAIVQLVALKHGYWNSWRVFDLAFVNYVLMAALIGLMVWAAGDMRRVNAEPLLLAICGTVALGFLSAPGVLLALALMVLGYAKHEWPLTTLGILFTPLSIFHYYYAIDTTLLMKSGILVGSGAVLLAGYAYMRLRQFGEGA